MKKTIAILLILVIGMAGVFAANNGSADLTLNVKVASRFGLIISDSSATGSQDVLANVTTFGTLSAVPAINFTDAQGATTLSSSTYYINYMTNIKNTATVTTSMSPLSSSTTGGKIGYKVHVGSTTYTVSKAGESVTEEGVTTTGLPLAVTLIAETSEKDSMRVISQAFSIDLESDDWNIAPAALDYTTTWTVTLLTN